MFSDTPGAASGSDGASGATGSQPVKSKKSGKKTSGDDNKPIPEPAERKSKPVRQVLCEYDELQDGQYVYPCITRIGIAIRFINLV